VREVDFVIKKGTKINRAIQVAISLSNKKVKDREMQVLMDAKDELSPDHFYHYH